MGLELTCLCHTQAQSHTIKAQLESHELVLRGDLRRTFPISSMSEVTSRVDGLSFCADGETYHLEMPEAVAAKWVRKIMTPPPSLAEKLGISAQKPALVWGSCNDEALNLVLSGDHKSPIEAAEIAVLIAESPDALTTGLAALSGFTAGHFVWIVHPKGPKSALPDRQIRETLRAMGLIDSKSCAVSDRLTATRYGRKS